MSDRRLDDTIDALTAGLKPVRRLAKPGVRALAWGVAAIVLAAVAYAWLGGAIGGLGTRPFALPSLIGSVLTAALGAVAAFNLSLPDRGDAWIWLPAPAVVLWVVSTIAGCIAGSGDAGTWGTTWDEVRACLTVIVGASVPLSALLIVMLRRSRPMRLVSVALTAGLAAAAAAGSVLLLANPHNSTLLDVAVHTLSVLAVVSISGLIGARVMRS